jgi:hypothetical protein
MTMYPDSLSRVSLAASRDKSPPLPFTRDIASEIDENLGKILKELHAQQLTDSPCVVYPVKDWKDLQWTASVTPAYRTLLPQWVREQRLSVEAVVVLVRSKDKKDEPLILISLWGRESGQGTQWKFLGLDVGPSH